MLARSFLVLCLGLGLDLGVRIHFFRQRCPGLGLDLGLGLSTYLRLCQRPTKRLTEKYGLFKQMKGLVFFLSALNCLVSYYLVLS